MFCKNCGKMLDGTENFCGGCGRKIKREMPPAKPATASHSVYDRQLDTEGQRQSIRHGIPGLAYDRQSVPEERTQPIRQGVSDLAYDGQPVSEEQREPIRHDVPESVYYRQPASEGQKGFIRRDVPKSEYYKRSALEEQSKHIQNNAYTAPYYGQSAMSASKEEGLFKSGMFMAALTCCSINIILLFIGAITETGGYGLILNGRAGVHVSEVVGFIITLLSCMPSVLILLGLWIAFLQSSGGLSLSVVGNMIRWVVADISYVIMIIAMLIFGIAGNDLLRHAGYYIRIGNAKDTILAIAFIIILVLIITAVIANLYYAKLNQVLRYARSVMEMPPAGQRRHGMASVSPFPPKIGYIRVMWVLMAIGNLVGIFFGIGVLDKLSSLSLVIAYILLAVWITGCRSRLESELWNRNMQEDLHKQ